MVGQRPQRADLEIAKNYLTQDELKRMNRLTTMFLDYADDQASMRKTILLDEWMQMTEKWLVFNDREVLKGFGKRQKKQAVKKANEEWDSYLAAWDAQVTEKDMAQLSREVKALKANHRDE